MLFMSIEWNVAQILQMFRYPKVVDTETCFCGNVLEPLVQSGRPKILKWLDQKVAAETCHSCCYVGFRPPTQQQLSDYYSRDYARNSSDYYSYEEDHDLAKTESRADLAVQLAQTFLPAREEPVILELGCAYGGSVAELRRRGRTAFGLDLNSEAIRIGQARGNAFIFDHAPARILDEVGNPVDAIISFHMLEHVPQIRDYLTDLLPVLSEGGVALFRVPNGAYLRPWLHGFDSWEWFAYPDHLHMLTPHSIACLVKACGFELVSLQSNACGESAESVTSWLPSGVVMDADAALVRLAEAGCLMELEVVIRKPGGTPPPGLSEAIEAARACAVAAIETEHALKRDPAGFAAALLSAPSTGKAG